MIAGALALWLATGAAALPGEVSVRLLGKAHPATVEVTGEGERHGIAARDGQLVADGAPVGARWSLPAGTWRIQVPGARPREVRGGVAFGVDGREVSIVVRMALEEHVAGVVAAESEPDTPAEALRALAVVARTFAVTAGGRHGDHDLCDLAHCQVMGPPAPRAHADAARAAARSTAGRVLRLPSGALAGVAFHAACGGHTADPVEVFGGTGWGSAAVADPGCPAAPWRALLPGTLLPRVVADLLGEASGPGGVDPANLHFVRGRGGWVVRVEDGRRSVRGEAFVRALDRSLGHGKVRSARFELRRTGSGYEVVGGGIGHGVGLCQAGAARRAATGAGYEAILGAYFPGARVEPAAPVTSAGAGPTAPRSAPLSRTSSR